MINPRRVRSFMIEKVNWLTDEAKDQLGYEYWNDETIEKEKQLYWCDSAECDKIYNNVSNLGIYDDLKCLLESVPTDAKVISLGAGVCWEAKLLISHGIKELDFLDFSEHRIMKTAPYVLEYLKCPKECNVRLILGSYYDVHVPANTYDGVVLSEALMMAEKPYELLKECYRILCGEGQLLIVGEPRLEMSIYKKLGRFIKKKLGIYISKLDESGAHNYLLDEYKKSFRKTGFRIKSIGKNNNKFWYFLLEKK